MQFFKIWINFCVLKRQKRSLLSKALLYLCVASGPQKKCNFDIDYQEIITSDQISVKQQQEISKFLPFRSSK